MGPCVRDAEGHGASGGIERAVELEWPRMPLKPQIRKAPECLSTDCVLCRGFGGHGIFSGELKGQSTWESGRGNGTEGNDGGCKDGLRLLPKSHSPGNRTTKCLTYM